MEKICKRNLSRPKVKGAGADLGSSHILGPQKGEGQDMLTAATATLSCWYGLCTHHHQDSLSTHFSTAVPKGDNHRLLHCILAVLSNHLPVKSKRVPKNGRQDLERRYLCTHCPARPLWQYLHSFTIPSGFTQNPPSPPLNEGSSSPSLAQNPFQISVVHLPVQRCIIHKCHLDHLSPKVEEDESEPWTPISKMETSVSLPQSSSLPHYMSTGKYIYCI